MKSVIIVPNTLKQATIQYAQELLKILGERGIDAKIYNDENEVPASALAIVLGGDGTILRSAKRFYGKDILLFGINFGHLGYLSAISPNEAIDGIERLVSGNYIIEQRTMLEGEIIRNGKSEAHFIGLNEACVFRSSLMHALRAELSINKKHTETIIGDGVVISTPTGSTAYNLSLGGPILTPTSKSMVVTPISPTYFPKASIVIDGGDEAEVLISFETADENGAPCIEIDGEIRYSLQNGDVIKIKRSEHTAQIVKITEKSFYQILREKLSRASLDQ
ncbi:MAG: NAD(+)/NADH kinase [Clostridia bacterium]|nr:NAD(+)/NADH kinase [Clostridia bacterium]